MPAKPKTAYQKEEAKISRLTKLYQSVDSPDSEIVPRHMKSSRTIAMEEAKRNKPVKVVKAVSKPRKPAAKKVVKSSELFYDRFK